MVDSIYKQAMLEVVATTYSDTENIVNGGKVMNMTSNDIAKVINLKRAWEFILNDGVISYPTNYAILCQINSIIEDGFSCVAGRLRSVPVIIANHYLISHGGEIIVVPAELVSEYKKLLILYYEDRSDDIKLFLKNKCWINV